MNDTDPALLHVSEGKTGEDENEPPGGILVWMIVFLELLTFGAGLGVFLFQGQQDIEGFRSSREMLNQPLAFANTLILLTGGWFMVNGLTSLRSGNARSSLRWIVAAIATGVGFMALKCVEYTEKIEHGISFGEDTFFTLYFLLTGFHVAHVFAAVVILLFLAVKIRKGFYTPEEHLDVESGAIFWHMCDLIWLLIFPVIYLL